MKIQNVRLGFATNSSSSHSIVIMDTQPKNNPPWSDNEFGWEWFVLSAKDSKMDYLVTAIWEDMKKMYGEDLAKTILNEWVGLAPPKNDGYIDHESSFGVPQDAMTKQLSREFLVDLANFLKRDDVVVLGGNDNEEPPSGFPYGDRYDYGALKRISWYDTSPLQKFLAKKSGDWWSIFNADTGAKMLLSFNQHADELKRSITPDLIDLKITDFCPFGCEFCYQDSTIRGNHANLTSIKQYIKDFADNGVYEIAIGGGEPMLHPNFPEILKYARLVGVVPNFTTKIMPGQWTSEQIYAVKNFAGSYAISGEGTHERAIKAVKAFDTLHGTKGVVHYVVGLRSGTWQLKAAISYAQKERVPLTLLGFKTVGRGEDFEPNMKEGYALGEVEKAYRISVDTSFVKQFPEIVSNFHETLVVPGEGRFSMYVDAVKEQAYISSYETENPIEYKPSYWDENNLMKAWRQI